MEWCCFPETCLRESSLSRSQTPHGASLRSGIVWEARRSRERVSLSEYAHGPPLAAQFSHLNIRDSKVENTPFTITLRNFDRISFRRRTSRHTPLVSEASDFRCYGVTSVSESLADFEPQTLTSSAGPAEGLTSPNRRVSSPLVERRITPLPAFTNGKLNFGRGRGQEAEPRPRGQARENGP